MTPIEIIALVLLIISTLKIVFLLFKPTAWYSSVGKIWDKPMLVTVMALVLGAVILKYLLVELTIVQVFASIGFTAMFYWLALAPYSKEMYNLVTRDMSQGSIWKRNWLSLVIWMALMIWVLRELFA